MIEVEEELVVDMEGDMIEEDQVAKVVTGNVLCAPLVFYLATQWTNVIRNMVSILDIDC